MDSEQAICGAKKNAVVSRARRTKPDVRERSAWDEGRGVVNWVGGGIDDAVRRIETSYTPRHALEKITSYDAASGGNVVNQVQFAYNGFNQLFREFQEHGGAVNTMTSPRVEYAYADGTANTTRRVPPGRGRRLPRDHVRQTLQASSLGTTSPATSVRRKSRP